MANASSSVNLLNSDLSFLFPGVSNKTLQDTNNSTTTKTMQTPNTELLAANNSLKQSRNVERSKKYNCAIINCNAEFCSDQNLQNHNVLFRHSPCNPCLLILNLQTPLEPQCYMCPECDQEFWDQTACQEHMLESLHLPFYPPLVITAYMCAQCLYLFENLESCWRHIEQMSHEGFYYPFSDEASGSNCLSGPIPVAKELVNDLVWKCNEVAYSVQCLECSLVMESRHQLLQHLQETQNQHLIASMTETSLVDIFTSYITDFSCDVCHRLLADPKENTKHQCAQSLSGTIIQNDIHSFLEFIKRCALTLVRSIDPSDEASRNQTAASSVVTQHHIESFIKQLATKRSSLINETENNPASRFEQNSNSVLTSVPGTSVKLFKNFALDNPDVIVVSDSDVSDSEDYVIDLTDVTLVDNTVTSEDSTVSSVDGTVNTVSGTVNSGGRTITSVGGTVISEDSTVSSVGETIMSVNETLTSVGGTVISEGGTFLQEIGQEKTATDVLLSSGTLHPLEKVNKSRNNQEGLSEKLRTGEQKKIILICEETLTSDKQESAREQAASSVPREEHLDQNINKKHITEDLFSDDVTDKKLITSDPDNAFRRILNILPDEIQYRNQTVVSTDVKSDMGLSTSSNGEDKMSLEGVNDDDVILKAFEKCKKTEELKMECDSWPLHNMLRQARFHIREENNPLNGRVNKRRDRQKLKKNVFKLFHHMVKENAETVKDTLEKCCSYTAVDCQILEVTNEKSTTPNINPSVNSVNCSVLSDSKKSYTSVINFLEEEASCSKKARSCTALLPTTTQSHSTLLSTQSQSHSTLLSTQSQSHTTSLPTQSQSHTTSHPTQSQSHTTSHPTQSQSHTTSLPTQSQSHTTLLPTQSQRAAVTSTDSFQNTKPSSSVYLTENKLKSCLTNQPQQFKYFNQAGSKWNKNFFSSFSNQSVANKWSKQSGTSNNSNQTGRGYQSNLTSRRLRHKWSGTSQHGNQSSTTVKSSQTSINYNSYQMGNQSVLRFFNLLGSNILNNSNHSNQSGMSYQSNLTSSGFQSNQYGTCQQSNQSTTTVESNQTSINYYSNQSGLSKMGNQSDTTNLRYHLGSDISNNNCTPRVSDASGQSSTESESYLTSTEHLQTMKNIVFLDLDNWCSFFQKLPRCLPDKTFVWGFYGGRRPWFPPQRSLVFHRMSSLGLFYLNEQCGTSKDAADFAIVLTVGTMNERLPTEVSFTILSGDTGFHEVERQMRKSKRRVMVINPHKAASISSDMIYALVTSVTET